MPVAVDTKVLLPVLRGDPGSAEILVPFLDRFIQSVGLVISGIVPLVAPDCDLMANTTGATRLASRCC